MELGPGQRDRSGRTGACGVADRQQRTALLALAAHTRSPGTVPRLALLEREALQQIADDAQSITRWRGRPLRRRVRRLVVWPPASPYRTGG